MRILKTRNPDYVKNFATNVPKKVFLSFRELTQFISDTYEKKDPHAAWDFRGCAELESYLERNDLKVRYSNNFDFEDVDPEDF